MRNPYDDIQVPVVLFGKVKRLGERDEQSADEDLDE